MAAADTIKKHLTCSICLEVFKVPKTLPCLHTFCRVCLDGHVRGVSTDGQYFECPLCRAKTIPVNKNSKEQWAKDFPTNHFVVSLLEDSTIRSKEVKKSTKDDAVICMPCSVEEKQKKGFCFCINCSEYLCKDCYEDHRKFKATREHDILKGNNLPTDVVPFQTLSLLRYCNIHSDKEIEFKCIIDKKLLCSICATTLHRKCENIEHIGNKVKEKQKGVLVSLDSTTELQTEVTQLLESKLSEADQLGSFASRVQNQTTELKRQLTAMIVELETNFESKFKTHIDNEKSKITVAVADLLGLNESLSQLNGVINVACKYGTQVQKESVNDLIQDVHSQIKQSMKMRDSSGLSMANDFVRGEVETLQDLMENKVFKQLHCISIRKDEASGETAFEPSRQPMGKITYKETHRMANIKTETTAEKPVNVSEENESCKNDWNTDISHSFTESNDELNDIQTPPLTHPQRSNTIMTKRSLLECDITKVAEYDISISACASKASIHNGSLILDNGTMIFIDRNNQLVKLVTKDFKINCYRTLKDKPLDVCNLNDGRIAVVSRKSVSIIAISTNVEKYHFQPTTETLRSACSLGEDLALLFSEPTDEDEEYYVELRDRSFGFVDKIDSFDSFGRKFALKNANIIRARYNHEILVCTPKKIMSVLLDGHVKWYYMVHDLLHAAYIAFDTKRNIYVCDLKSNSIHQIAAGSFKKSRVLVRDVRRPTSVLFNERNQTLVVGCFDDNKVHVYQFV